MVTDKFVFLRYKSIIDINQNNFYVNQFYSNSKNIYYLTPAMLRNLDLQNTTDAIDNYNSSIAEYDSQHDWNYLILPITEEEYNINNKQINLNNLLSNGHYVVQLFVRDDNNNGDFQSRIVTIANSTVDDIDTPTTMPTPTPIIGF